MEIKKSLEADINKKSKSLLLMGLMCSMAIVLVAFQWKTFEPRVVALADFTDDMMEDEYVPPSEQLKPPPPPPPPEQKAAVILDIIEDDAEEEESLEATDNDVDEDKEVESVDIPDEVEPEEEPILMMAQEMPEFPGGPAAFAKFLQDNIQYPDMAQDADITGKVYVKFIVKKNGAIDKVQVLKGIGGGCDEEAIRVIKSVPKWKPGENMGKKVNVWFTVPINFQLM